jgi:segregation and condensation protein B
MSLKAKIEAVIYAAEEPVTLAQLVGVLGEEAQAELDREIAVQQTLLAEAEANASAGAEPALGPDFNEAELDGPAPPVEALTIADDPGQVGGGEPLSEHPATVLADAGAAARAEKARAAKLRGYFRTVLDQLIAEYAAPESDRGLEIREVAGGFRLATKPEYHDAVRGFVK